MQSIPVHRPLHEQLLFLPSPLLLLSNLPSTITPHLTRPFLRHAALDTTHPALNLWHMHRHTRVPLAGLDLNPQLNPPPHALRTLHQLPQRTLPPLMQPPHLAPDTHHLARRGGLALVAPSRLPLPLRPRAIHPIHVPRQPCVFVASPLLAAEGIESVLLHPAVGVGVHDVAFAGGEGALAVAARSRWGW